MLMLHRSYASTANYRFGFIGQEMDNEIKGLGNLTTAQFWEYDSRIGRRWNIDPLGKPWESSYSALSNNPINRIDPLGLTSNDPQNYTVKKVTI
ncbi:MAG: hypothetical protein IPP79_04975 [Chitinophagaceae bacterium]|nr:hypothetical protein [Chitinophagaceae bacterium]